MGIKSKSKGPTPIFPERWQNLATDPQRTVDAVKAYMELHKGAKSVEASRVVKRFQSTL